MKLGKEKVSDARTASGAGNLPLKLATNLRPGFGHNASIALKEKDRIYGEDLPKIKQACSILRQACFIILTLGGTKLPVFSRRHRIYFGTATVLKREERSTSGGERGKGKTFYKKFFTPSDL